MTLQEIKMIAKGKNVKTGKNMKKAEIIRVIQKHEGNEDCFSRGKADACGQAHCLWRTDCVNS